MTSLPNRIVDKSKVKSYHYIQTIQHWTTTYINTTIILWKEQQDKTNFKENVCQIISPKLKIAVPRKSEKGSSQNGLQRSYGWFHAPKWSGNLLLGSAGLGFTERVRNERGATNNQANDEKGQFSERQKNLPSSFGSAARIGETKKKRYSLKIV